jgi:hypothetical protein
VLDENGPNGLEAENMMHKYTGRMLISASYYFYLIKQSRLNKMSSIFSDITPWRPKKVNWRFGGICCLHFKDRRIKQG